MHHNHPKGYSTLTFIIIITGILLSLSLFLHARIREGQSDFDLIHASERAASSSLSCIEEGHLRLQRDRSYTGAKLNIAGATCTISINQVGTEYDITSTGKYANVSRVFRLHVVEQSGKLEPTSFNEIP